jgi:alkylhydroperoxidase family enzyme
MTPDEDVSGTFLSDPPPSDEVARFYAADVADTGYVMNLSRVWAHRPELQDRLSELLLAAAGAANLTFRQRGVLVAACASAKGDSYCALAWGNRLAGAAGPDVAAAVLRGDDAPLDVTERALARWARTVARDANGATAADVQELRDAGFDDAQILAITAYVAGRLAFSTVNDALGARPDRQLVDAAPEPVRAAVTFGRPAAGD